MWNLRWGSSIKAFMAREKATGIRARPMLERPTLKHEDLPFREAFLILNSARTSSMSGVNPLAVTEILGLINMGGIAYFGEKPKYLRLVQRLDSTFLEYQAEKASKTAKA